MSDRRLPGQGQWQVTRGAKGSEQLSKHNPALTSAIDQFDSLIGMDVMLAVKNEDEHPSATQQPGLQRIYQAGTRLSMLVRLLGEDGDIHPIVSTIDHKVVKTFHDTIEPIVFKSWNIEIAFEASSMIEEYIMSRCVDFLERRRVREDETLSHPIERLADDATTAVRDIRLESRLYEQLTRAEAIVSDVEQAAGIVAEGRLAEEFGAYGKAEEASANAFRKAAMAVLVGVLLFSIYTTVRIPTSLGSSLAHLGIGLSSLAAFGYLARESAHHRRAGRWGSVLAVQLRTLAAYSADMSAEQRQNLRNDFGRRVFSDPGQPEASASDVSELIPALQVVLDLVKASRSISQ